MQYRNPMIRFILFISFLLCTQLGFSQVGINTTSPEAQLDIRSSNQVSPSNKDGILIPKIDVFPATNPTVNQQGMMVYLTTTSGTNLPGFYYWDNLTTTWTSIGAQHNWGLNGNSGTNATTNFVGTKDNQSLVIRTNNTERMKVDNTGNIGIGGVNPTHPLEFKSITGDKICLYNSGPSKSYGFGIDNSLLQVFSSNNGSAIGFGYGSSTSFTENVRFTGWGYVGIGTSNPLSKLHVKDGSAALIPNGNAIATIESNGPAYFNILSGSESGITFGANGNATNGGIYYNTAGNVNGMQFRTNFNTTKMVLSSAGNLALGSFVADYPLQFATTFGDKLSLYGGLGAHYGFGIQGNLLQVHSDLVNSDISFGYGSSNSFTENVRFTGGGSVGIGTSNPFSKLHIKSNTTGMTPNPFALATIENDQFTFLNLLSNQESGVVFGTNGVATSGGIIYSPASMPNSLQFRTDNNTTRMTISDTGNVGIGFFKADYPLQFATTLGDKLSLYGGLGAHYGFGIQSALLQIHSAASTDDIAFGYGTSTSFTENIRIKGTGKVGIGTSAPSSELEVNGFTKLGSAAPAVKMIKLTGTTGAVQGNQISINHGVNSAKILSVSVLVEYSSGNYIPPSYTGSIGYEYDYYVTPTSVFVWTKNANSGFILSKPIRVLVTYEQ